MSSNGPNPNDQRPTTHGAPFNVAVPNAQPSGVSGPGGTANANQTPVQSQTPGAVLSNNLSALSNAFAQGQNTTGVVGNLPLQMSLQQSALATNSLNNHLSNHLNNPQFLRAYQAYISKVQQQQQSLQTAAQSAASSATSSTAVPATLPSQATVDTANQSTVSATTAAVSGTTVSNSATSSDTNNAMSTVTNANVANLASRTPTRGGALLGVTAPSTPGASPSPAVSAAAVPTTATNAVAKATTTSTAANVVTAAATGAANATAAATTATNAANLLNWQRYVQAQQQSLNAQNANAQNLNAQGSATTGAFGSGQGLVNSAQSVANSLNFASLFGLSRGYQSLAGSLQAAAPGGIHPQVQSTLQNMQNFGMLSASAANSAFSSNDPSYMQKLQTLNQQSMLYFQNLSNLANSNSTAAASNTATNAATANTSNASAAASSTTGGVGDTKSSTGGVADTSTNAASTVTNQQTAQGQQQAQQRNLYNFLPGGMQNPLFAGRSAVPGSTGVGTMMGGATNPLLLHQFYSNLAQQALGNRLGTSANALGSQSSLFGMYSPLVGATGMHPGMNMSSMNYTQTNRAFGGAQTLNQAQGVAGVAAANTGWNTATGTDDYSNATLASAANNTHAHPSKTSATKEEVHSKSTAVTSRSRSPPESDVETTRSVPVTPKNRPAPPTPVIAPDVLMYGPLLQEPGTFRLLPWIRPQDSDTPGTRPAHPFLSKRTASVFTSDTTPSSSSVQAIHPVRTTAHSRSQWDENERAPARPLEHYPRGQGSRVSSNHVLEVANALQDVFPPAVAEVSGVSDSTGIEGRNAPVATRIPHMYVVSDGTLLYNPPYQGVGTKVLTPEQLGHVLERTREQGRGEAKGKPGTDKDDDKGGQGSDTSNVTTDPLALTLSHAPSSPPSQAHSLEDPDTWRSGLSSHCTATRPGRFLVSMHGELVPLAFTLGKLYKRSANYCSQLLAPRSQHGGGIFTEGIASLPPPLPPGVTVIPNTTPISHGPPASTTSTRSKAKASKPSDGSVTSIIPSSSIVSSTTDTNTLASAPTTGADDASDNAYRSVQHSAYEILQNPNLLHVNPDVPTVTVTESGSTSSGPTPGTMGTRAQASAAQSSTGSGNGNRSSSGKSLREREKEIVSALPLSVAQILNNSVLHHPVTPCPTTSRAMINAANALLPHPLLPNTTPTILPTERPALHQMYILPPDLIPIAVGGDGHPPVHFFLDLPTQLAEWDDWLSKKMYRQWRKYKKQTFPTAEKHHHEHVHTAPPAPGMTLRVAPGSYRTHIVPIPVEESAVKPASSPLDISKLRKDLVSHPLLASSKPLFTSVEHGPSLTELEYLLIKVRFARAWSEPYFSHTRIGEILQLMTPVPDVQITEWFRHPTCPEYLIAVVYKLQLDPYAYLSLWFRRQRKQYTRTTTSAHPDPYPEKSVLDIANEIVDAHPMLRIQREWIRSRYCRYHGDVWSLYEEEPALVVDKVLKRDADKDKDKDKKEDALDPAMSPMSKVQQQKARKPRGWQSLAQQVLDGVAPVIDDVSAPMELEDDESDSITTSATAHDVGDNDNDGESTGEPMMIEDDGESSEPEDSNTTVAIATAPVPSSRSSSRATLASSTRPHRRKVIGKSTLETLLSRMAYTLELYRSTRSYASHSNSRKQEKTADIEAIHEGTVSALKKLRTAFAASDKDTATITTMNPYVRKLTVNDSGLATWHPKPSSLPSLALYHPLLSALLFSPLRLEHEEEFFHPPPTASSAAESTPGDAITTATKQDDASAASPDLIVIDEDNGQGMVTQDGTLPEEGGTTKDSLQQAPPAGGSAGEGMAMDLSGDNDDDDVVVVDTTRANSPQKEPLWSLNRNARQDSLYAVIYKLLQAFGSIQGKYSNGCDKQRTVRPSGSSLPLFLSYLYEKAKPAAPLMPPAPQSIPALPMSFPPLLSHLRAEWTLPSSLASLPLSFFPANALLPPSYFTEPPPGVPWLDLFTLTLTFPTPTPGSSHLYAHSDLARTSDSEANLYPAPSPPDTILIDGEKYPVPLPLQTLLMHPVLAVKASAGAILVEPTLTLSSKPKTSTTTTSTSSSSATMDSTTHPVPAHPHVLLVLLPLGAIGDPKARDLATKMRRRERPSLFRLLQDRDPRFTRPDPTDTDGGTGASGHNGRDDGSIGLASGQNGSKLSGEIPFLLPNSATDVEYDKTRENYWSEEEGEEKAKDMVLSDSLLFQNDMGPCSLFGNLEGIASLPTVFPLLKKHKTTPGATTKKDESVSNTASESTSNSDLGIIPRPKVDVTADSAMDTTPTASSSEEILTPLGSQDLSSGLSPLAPVTDANTETEAVSDLSEVKGRAIARNGETALESAAPTTARTSDHHYTSAVDVASTAKTSSTAHAPRRSKRMRKYSSEQARAALEGIMPTMTSAMSPGTVPATAPVVTTTPDTVTSTTTANSNTTTNTTTNKPTEKRPRTRRSLTVDKNTAEAAAVLPWEVHSPTTPPNPQSPNSQPVPEPVPAGPVTRKRKLSQAFAATADVTDPNSNTQVVDADIPLVPNAEKKNETAKSLAMAAVAKSTLDGMDASTVDSPPPKQEERRIMTRRRSRGISLYNADK